MKKSTALFAVLLITLAPYSLAEERPDKAVSQWYEFDFEFFRKLEKLWRQQNGFKDSDLVRINPRGLIEACGIKVSDGENFIHENIGARGFIYFRATQERQAKLKQSYMKLMAKGLREVSEKEIMVRRKAQSHGK